MYIHTYIRIVVAIAISVLLACKSPLEQLEKKGLELAKEGNNEEAIKTFKQLLYLNPTSVVACLNIGVLYLRNEQMDSSIRYLNNAILLDSTHANAYYNRGKYYDGVGNFMAALNDFSTCIKLEPTLLHCWVLVVYKY